MNSSLSSQSPEVLKQIPDPDPHIEGPGLVGAIDVSCIPEYPAVVMGLHLVEEVLYSCIYLESCFSCKFKIVGEEQVGDQEGLRSFQSLTCNYISIFKSLLFQGIICIGV